jgi:hypothetical protein
MKRRALFLVAIPIFALVRANAKVTASSDYASSLQIRTVDLKAPDGTPLKAIYFAAAKPLSLLDSHKTPLSSWSDTEERRGEIRRDIERALAASKAAGH